MSDGAERTPPRVSVSIPVLNGEDYVGAAIESVLSQTYEDFELIVVDNASDDATTEVVSGFDDDRLRLERHDERLPMDGNWNRALNATSGAYVKVMAHDDVLYPECLAREVAALDAHPSAVMASCRRDIIDGDGKTIVADRGLAGLQGVIDGHDVIRRVARAGTNIIGEGVATLIRGGPARSSPGFGDEWPYAIDLEFWTRLLRGSDMVAIPETLSAFRVSTASWSLTFGSGQGQQLRSFTRHLGAVEPDVGRLDVILGLLRATYLGVMRRVLYGWLAIRRRVRGRGKGS